MFTHILVPTDLTERSLKAVDIALKIALNQACGVTLLHVIETIDDTEADEFQDFYKKLERRAVRRMEQITALFPQCERIVRREIIYGKRVREIVRYAKETDIDLIVLSSHRIDVRDPNAGWGSISYKVSILSDCPVMLVK